MVSNIVSKHITVLPYEDAVRGRINYRRVLVPYYVTRRLSTCKHLACSHLFWGRRGVTMPYSDPPQKPHETLVNGSKLLNNRHKTCFRKIFFEKMNFFEISPLGPPLLTIRGRNSAPDSLYPNAEFRPMVDCLC